MAIIGLGYVGLPIALEFSRAVLMGEVTAKFEDIEAVILSHGHFDHCGGLLDYLNEANKNLPIF